MNRRKYLKHTSLATLGWSVLGSKLPVLDTNIETALDLHNYMRSLYEVSEPSVDRIIIGDPDTKISKVGTCWMPFLDTLKKAKEQGVNVFVVHEPTFYTHWDLQGIDDLTKDMPAPAKAEYEKAISDKKKWIEQNEMVIIRSHDVLDVVKDFGMPYALGQALGFTNEDIVRSKDYFNVYGVEEDKAINVAKRISDALKSLGQPGVKFYGDKERLVRTLCVGTGYICDPRNSRDLKPDLSVAIDDTMRAWIQPYVAADTGYPLVVINHGTSEDSGMKLLSEFLGKNIEHLEFIHFKQGCAFEWV